MEARAGDPYTNCVTDCAGCNSNCIRNCTERCCDDYSCTYTDIQEFCCEENQSCCDGLCPVLADDPANCGSCGNVCLPAQTCCAGTCVDLQTDPGNCGRCGRGCGPGSCESGDCVCGTHLRCGDSCVSRFDDRNCGACGNDCGPGRRCHSDRAVVDPITGEARPWCGCPDPTHLDCNRGQGPANCVDATKEPNCGACGVTCSGGKFCRRTLDTEQWGCWCPSDRTDCNGTCVDLRNDAQNCGACATTCSGGKTCQNGECLCPAGLVDCAGTCVNLTSDVGNCGACGHVCTGGTTCQNGVCLCPPGLIDCAGTCVNLVSDVGNCGVCGHACYGGRLCQNGVCVCPPGHVDCAGTCRNLREDPANCGTCGTVCAPDRVCFNGSCQCRSPLIDCQGTCRDRLNDPVNCGSCGNVCPPGTACCNGACRDITGDPKNCGGCNRSCPTDCTGAQRCSNGTCVEPQPFEVFFGTAQGCALRSAFYLAFDVNGAVACGTKEAGPGWRVRSDPPQAWPVCARCPGGPPLGDYVLSGYQPAWSPQEATNCWNQQHLGCNPAVLGLTC